MATIQIRDVPDDTYASLRGQAEAAGQSLQQFMREQLIDLVGDQERKAAVSARIERRLETYGGSDVTPEIIVEHLHADRR